MFPSAHCLERNTQLDDEEEITGDRQDACHDENAAPAWSGQRQGGEYDLGDGSDKEAGAFCQQHPRQDAAADGAEGAPGKIMASCLAAGPGLDHRPFPPEDQGGQQDQCDAQHERNEAGTHVGETANLVTEGNAAGNQAGQDQQQDG